jgi:hypothetical protein
MRGFEVIRHEALDFDRNVAISVLYWFFSSAVAIIALLRLGRIARAQRSGERGTWTDPYPVAFGRGLEWFGASCTLLIVLAFAQSLHAARALMPVFTVPLTTPADEIARSWARSFGGQLNTLMVCVFLMPVPVLVGVTATALAHCARLRSLGLVRAALLAERDKNASTAWLRYPGPAPLAVLFMLLVPATFMAVPLWHGVYRFGLEYISGLGAAANLPKGSDRGAFMAAVGVRGRTQLAALVSWAYGGVVLGTAIAGVGAWVLSAERKRDRLLASAGLREPGDWGAWAMSAGMLAIAAALVAAAEPMRQENETPWPIVLHASSLQLPIQTPDLQPQDELPMAPLLTVGVRSLTLDGRQLSKTKDLAADLDILKSRRAVLHPADTFAGKLIFACNPAVATARVSEVLRTAADVGFSNVSFAFAHSTVIRRPAIGSFAQKFTVAATVAVVTKNEPQTGARAVMVEAQRHPDCASLCAEIVKQRLSEHSVAVLLPAVTSADPPRTR